MAHRDLTREGMDASDPRTFRDLLNLQPAVQERIERFIEEVRPDIEAGMGLKVIYNVRNVGDLRKVLARFERTAKFDDDRHGELINDYLIFIRSANIVDDNPV